MLKEELKKVIDLMTEEQVEELLRDFDAYNCEYGSTADAINGDIETELYRLIDMIKK